MKKRPVLHFIMTLLLGTLGCHASQALQPKGNEPLAKSQRDNREWHVATYQGLKMGESTRADAVRSLGKPQRKDAPADQAKNDPNPEEWYIYENLREFPGTATVFIDKKSGVITGIELYPTNLTKQAAIKHFGDDYIVTRYNFDECQGGEESAPLYESPKGEIEMIEYRDRGIAIAYNYRNEVDHISYVSKPIGAAASKCPSSQ